MASFYFIVRDLNGNIVYEGWSDEQVMKILEERPNTYSVKIHVYCDCSKKRPETYALKFFGGGKGFLISSIQDLQEVLKELEELCIEYCEEDPENIRMRLYHVKEGRIIDVVGEVRM